MLCLMTLADIERRRARTPSRRGKKTCSGALYVDAYNHLTLGYADELIERDPAGLSVLCAGPSGRHHRRRAARASSRDCRAAIFRSSAWPIYRHVRLARDIRRGRGPCVPREARRYLGADASSRSTSRSSSRISAGVLSYFGMDILRGQAMTTPDGLVLDVFQFTDQEGFLQHNRAATADITRCSKIVVAGIGGRDSAAQRQGAQRRLSPPAARGARRAFRQRALAQYTVLEILADDAPGLLYRISRVISRHGCDVDLVLISTEGRKAIDVFTCTRRGAKLSDSEEQELKAGSGDACWKAPHMKLIKSIVRPNKVDDVRDALGKLNISGMTVTEVRGHGRQKGHRPSIAARSTTSASCRRWRSKSSCPTGRRRSDPGHHAAARTGEIGDGRVFVLPVEQGYNIRTGERDAN